MRLAPDRPDIAFAACRAMLRVGNADAGPLVQDLLRRFPDHAAGWEEIGLELKRSGKYEAAVACWQRAATTAPSGRLDLARGRALRHLGRRKEARVAFEDARLRDPSSATAHFLAGVAAQDDRDLPAAEAAYRSALDRDPALAEAAVNLGTVLQEQGRVPEAKAAYGIAIRLRADTFGRVAQAMTAAPHGELWLDLGRLRRDLAG